MREDRENVSRGVAECAEFKSSEIKKNNVSRGVAECAEYKSIEENGTKRIVNNYTPSASQRLRVNLLGADERTKGRCYAGSQRSVSFFITADGRG